jgi:hypothetical protein
MSIDKFLGKVYNKNTYNCAHFVVEVWEHLTKRDISDAFACFLLPEKERTASMSIRNHFTKLEKPVNLCIVLMQRPRTEPHVGLFYNNRVLHINEKGVQFMPLEIASFGYNKIGFYSC